MSGFNFLCLAYFLFVAVWLLVAEQLTAWKDSSPNDLLYVECDIKSYSLTHAVIRPLNDIVKNIFFVVIKHITSYLALWSK